MMRWSWLVCALGVLGVACGPAKPGPDAGSGGGLSGVGGGLSGTGGGSVNGGGSVAGGGSAGGMTTGGGSAGGSSMGGGAAAGGMATGGGGVVVFDGGLQGGETCANATALPGSAVLNGTTTGAMDDLSFLSATSADCAPGDDMGTGTDAVYSVSVPPGMKLTAAITSMWDATINLVPAPDSNCSAAMVTCLAGTDDTVSGTESVEWFNGSTTAQTVFIAIDGYSAGDEGDYSLEVTLAIPPLGDDCTAPQPLALGDGGIALPMEATAGFRNDFPAFTGTNCEFLGGPDRVYSLTIPANRRLVVSATGSANINLSLLADLAACTSTPIECLVGVDNAFTGMPEVLTFDNTNTTPLDVLLQVSNSASTMAGATYSLNVDVVAIPPGDSCGMPTSLTLVDGGVALPGEALTGFADDYSFTTNDMGCLFTSGPDRVYSVNVPGGSRLTVRTSSQDDLRLNLVDGVAACTADPLVCSQASDTGSGGSMGSPETEQAFFSNSGTTAKSVIVIVDSSGGSAGTYDLSATVGPIPPPAYTVAMMSAACDSFSGVTPTVLLDATSTPAIGDDVVTAATALPFAFNFFGMPVSHYAASTNGNIQLFDSATATGSTAYSNVAIPTPSLPNGFVASFWDDLAPGSSSRVVANVFGTGTTRHLTVQWEMDVRLTMGAAVVVQARLFETTNVIELHACTLTASSLPGEAGRELGSSATVGLESPTGVDGLQFSFDMPNLVAGQQLRYTP